MTTSSEDVLMQVGQVRYKKGDGTLYVMNERIAWMLDNRDTVSVSHKYADIKLQKISPEGKSKIQLQVVLHDGSSSTFHFVNRNGQEAQIKDRDDVKELLQQLLPKFKRKVNKELEEKNRMLQENPVLLQLYRDLVIPQVITSEEFWTQHAAEYTRAKKVQRQEIGVNGAFLADIKPQTDGCNGLKYNLTIDVIECIFKTYPAVKRKHQENVPHKMTEADFWTKFFQSHYFHRDRINAGTKDLFTECAKIDDQELKKDIQSGINDPLVDITSFEDQTLDENYGSGLSKSDKTSGNIVHQSMIKRFNQHSIMVLKASTTKQSTQNSQPQLNGSTPSVSKASTNDQPDIQPKNKKLRIQEKLIYDDLDASCDSNTNNGAPLCLTHVDRYLHGPVPGYGMTEAPSDELLMAVNQLQKEAASWISGNGLPRQAPTSLVSPAAAVSALGELTPGGSLMKSFREESLGQLIPKDLETELRNVYVCICQLLRHFWRSFPPTTPQLEEKAIRMHEALHRFHSVKLKPFEDRVQREFSAISQHLTSHLNQLLNTAYRKFALWQQRKMQMR
ncbi:general transcription factor IIH subunit 1-like [Vespa mandarinia]|uniref:general transcription factor IIH subunit 1-like n=1 Tax=Vespa mandarinia TaxID=7446 RepID=UPI00161950F0|nr:general transcription factor IIH subunit 1-like [Vespa mandarinia]XP_035726220.1 general transcription factor IIH subunit 1-like [Vespa mandarinia]XP_035726221.1 general transcription factor IIH subunit 1-like [Vespa mandarinia]XP_046835149.1 general transcription factor IIH subunit 1 [Vespa crabro]XP_046835150.1 general transcription factor IIH subunit 1 [Vespa crabro]XP_046835151.1 general transcription factor IIH subunit 1 [Vespa crabro]